MIKTKKIAVVVPAYNEENQIGRVIETMPQFVDYIVIVNDASKDKTHDVVVSYIDSEQFKTDVTYDSILRIIPEETLYNRAEIVSLRINEEQEAKLPKHEVYKLSGTLSKIVLIDNLENAKVGGAIAIGYNWCRSHGIDCVAVMAGDGQMDPDELYDICYPVCEEHVDYVKGNRLVHKAAKAIIPRTRYFGNSILSALTKVASGYWRVSDTQTGYTSISLSALEKIELNKIYHEYGVPNDILVKLNIAKCTLKEVPIKPVYNVGEKSKMRIGKVVFRVPGLLIRGFIHRIITKYVINDFHPISLFYFLALANKIVAIYFFAYVVVGMFNEGVTTGTYLGFVLFFIMGWFFAGFAMWLDIYDNDRYQI